MLDRLVAWLGRALAVRLLERSSAPPAVAPTDLGRLSSVLRACDVLLVEGDRRISTAIKYLTQSTWSHAALYVGDLLGAPGGAEPLVCIEAHVADGVRAVPLSEFAGLNVRVCRPVGLSAEDSARVVSYMASRLGNRYDLRHVFDLARYLFPMPPVPMRWRRRMLALGSGDPTRAICSTLIAQAFQSVRYPILPEITREMAADPGCESCVSEILQARHHSLFVPRDFDLSPYFEVVKPALANRFDYRSLRWAEVAEAFRDAAADPPDGPGAHPAQH